MMTSVASPAFFKSIFEKANKQYDQDISVIYFIKDGFGYSLHMGRRFNYDNKLYNYPDYTLTGLAKFANAINISYEVVGVFTIELYFGTRYPSKVRTDDGPEIDPDVLYSEKIHLHADTTMEDVEHLLMLAALSEDTYP